MTTTEDWQTAHGYGCGECRQACDDVRREGWHLRPNGGGSSIREGRNGSIHWARVSTETDH